MSSSNIRMCQQKALDNAQNFVKTQIAILHAGCLRHNSNISLVYRLHQKKQIPILLIRTTNSYISSNKK